MLELNHNSLHFSFPDIHRDARCRVEFQRTLRIPDNDRTHHLPPGLGGFPLRHVDDYASRIPETWRQHGGVMMPMFQSEAMWINFSSPSDYPFLVKIATGKINAVTGDTWQMAPQQTPQDYVVIPDQPWLDGYCVEKGVIRQFVAMPLGAGYTAEEQITGKAEHGGVQVAVYPMKKEEWEKILMERGLVLRSPGPTFVTERICLSCNEIGLAPGGKMKQQIHDDPYDFSVWDLDHVSRCFVHIANSISWRAITGEAPPTMPPTARDYTKAGLPWFDHYRPDAEVVAATDTLEGLKSVKQVGLEKGQMPLPENDPVGEVKPKKLF